MNSDNIEECEDLGYVMIDSEKKALLFNQKLAGSVEKQLKTLAIEKKPEKLIPEIENRVSNHMSEDEDDDDDDHVEVIIDDPIVTPFNGYKKYYMPEKYETYSKFKGMYYWYFFTLRMQQKFPSKFS